MRYVAILALFALACSGGGGPASGTYVETEPNNWGGEANFVAVADHGYHVTLVGQMDGDPDVFEIELIGASGVRIVTSGPRAELYSPFTAHHLGVAMPGNPLDAWNGHGGPFIVTISSAGVGPYEVGVWIYG